MIYQNKKIVEKGFKYNIHVVASIRRSSRNWYASNTFLLSRLLLFNENDFATDLDNSFYVKEMLKNVSNNGYNETLAVWFTKKSLSKIRPIIFDRKNNDIKNIDKNPNIDLLGNINNKDKINEINLNFNYYKSNYMCSYPVNNCFLSSEPIWLIPYLKHNFIWEKK